MTRGKRRSGSDDTTFGWWVRQTVSWVLLLSMLALLTATVILPKVAGATPYTVLTGSMRPGMPPGSLAVTRPVAHEQLKTGDAITYQIRSGEPEVVTHRIISVSTTFGGERLFRTQGDANPSPDDKQVKAGQIRGVVWYSLPMLGYVNTWLTGEQHIWAVGATAVLLVGYAAFMCTAALVDSRKAKKRSTPILTAVDAE
jgi:signal peptidase